MTATMKKITFSLHTPTETNDMDTWVLPAFSEGAQPQVSQPAASLIEQLMTDGDFQAKVGQTRLLIQPNGVDCKRLLLVGLGNHDQLTVKSYLSACQAMSKSLKASGATQVLNGLATVFPNDQNADWAIYQNTLNIQKSLYQYQHESRGKQEPTSIALNEVRYPGEPNAETQAKIDQAQATAFGMEMTQDLANMPANFCTPTYLAQTAQQLGQTYGFEVNILDKADMLEMGMGSFMAVAQGSEEPPKMISLSYQGTDDDQAPIALVGKGVTFDTGGISLKPGQAMDEMKYDMGGAATVLGIFEALGRFKPSINVVGVIPATENMPSGIAAKPGDVVKSLSGQTIEILNTDAEGRLILCDALTYTQQTFKPSKIIDMATLTGACIIALGHHISGLLGNDQALVDAIKTAGDTTYDRFWQLPLSAEYDEQLKSNFADMGNIGGRPAGTITAAQFLARFTQDIAWAHCDIAGTAWESGANKGATGRPVPALVEFLIQQSH